MAQDPPPAPVPPPVPAPPPAPAPPVPAQEPGAKPGDPGAKERTPSLSIQELDILLLRAQQNLRLHGLSLVPTTLQWAIRDYRAAVKGLPADADADRRFHALFGLAFSLTRSTPPPDPAGKEALAAETQDLLVRASKVPTEPPGLYAAHPGLWIVDGLMREQGGDFADAEKQITRGFALLDEFTGQHPWQDDQLRFFGLLARGRAFLQPPLNREDLALKDFQAALAGAEKALKDPLYPRESRMRPVVLTHLAAAYQALDNFEDTEKILLDLVRTDPGNAAHLYNMGLVKAAQQRFAEALHWYRRSAGLDISVPRVHLKIAFILLRYPDPGKRPDVEDAIRAGEIYLRLVGGEPDAEYCALRGEAAYVRDDLKEAESWFRRALADAPRCRTALQRMMNILGQKEDPTDAVRKEIEELRKRLQDSKDKDPVGPGMDNRKKGEDLTFC